MTHPPHTGHRAIIQAAIEDWWITTDLMAPFDTHDVTAQIEMYLTSSGYQITPDIPRTHRMPTRTAIALTATLALICLGGAIASAIQGDWGWAFISLVGAGAFTYELLGDLADRRHHTHADQTPTAASESGKEPT